MEIIELSVFEWLAQLGNHISSAPKRRKNIIEIAGFPRWENVNSNILAFFLQNDEDHLMGQLFFDSLLELIDEVKPFNRNMFDSSYSVKREVSNVDILITSETAENEQKWAIIIENKIHHSLVNDLTKYWNGVNATHKLGVVLTLKPINEKQLIAAGDIVYANITHLDLVNKVKQNLPQYFEEADDRHLLFLKEYFSNIQSHYEMEQVNPTHEANIKLIQNNAEKITELKNIETAAKRYLIERIYKIMSNHGFEPNNNYLAAHKHYYRYTDGVVDPLRFWINIDDYFYYNTIEVYYELHGEYSKYGKKVKEILHKQNAFDMLVNAQEGNGVSEGAHFHIAYIYKELEENTADTDATLEKHLSPFFRTSGEAPAFVDICRDAIAKAAMEEQVN